MLFFGPGPFGRGGTHARATVRRGGRGHQGSCFTLVFAGGGLNHKGAYGATDDLSKKVIERPVSVPEFHATIHAALDINPSHELFDGSRPVPITNGGKPITALFG